MADKSPKGDFESSNALRRMATLKRIMHMEMDAEDEAALAAADAADWAKGTPPIRPRRIHRGGSTAGIGRHHAERHKSRSPKRRPKRLLTRSKFTAAYKMMEPKASQDEIDQAYKESKRWYAPEFDAGKQHRKLGRSAEAMGYNLDSAVIHKIDTGLDSHKEAAHVVEHQTTNNEEGGRERRECARRAEFDKIMQSAGRHRPRSYIEADTKQARVERERAEKRAVKKQLQQQREAAKLAQKQQKAAKAAAAAKKKAVARDATLTKLARSATFSI